MIIRKMEERDIAEVVAIEEETFSSPWSADSFLQESKNKNNIYLVVEDNGEVIGYCGLWGVVGEGQITNVAVRKDNRNRGVGKIMLTKLLELGVNQGLESFTLEVRESNKSALRVYQSLGFYSAGIRKNFYTEPTEHAVIMWLHK